MKIKKGSSCITWKIVHGCRYCVYYVVFKIYQVFAFNVKLVISRNIFLKIIFICLFICTYIYKKTWAYAFLYLNIYNSIFFSIFKCTSTAVGQLYFDKGTLSLLEKLKWDKNMIITSRLIMWMEEESI